MSSKCFVSNNTVMGGGVGCPFWVIFGLQPTHIKWNDQNFSFSHMKTNSNWGTLNGSRSESRNQRAEMSKTKLPNFTVCFFPLFLLFLGGPLRRLTRTNQGRPLQMDPYKNVRHTCCSMDKYLAMTYKTKLC